MGSGKGNIKQGPKSGQQKKKKKKEGLGKKGEDPMGR